MSQPLVWALGLALLWVPGRLIRSFLHSRPPYDRVVQFGGDLAVGLSFWPILFLWTSVAGVHWTPIAARAAAGALVVLTIGLEMHARRGQAHEVSPGMAKRSTTRRRSPRMLAPSSVTSLVLAIVIVLTAWSRIHQIRGIALPLWVDSVHHTMIVRLLLEHGAIPTSYAPFIPNSSFYYHWGFHAIVAFLAWIGGVTKPIDIARLLLDFGQFLNALTAVTIYAAASVLFSNRRAGAIAAVFASLVSLFPAYYVSWGRYTHLTGVLLLPMIGVTLWQASRNVGSWKASNGEELSDRRRADSKQRTADRGSIGIVRRFGSLIELAILAAGLMLIHIRVAFFAATFAMVLGIMLFFSARKGAAVRWLAAGAVALIVVSPWLIRLARNEQVRRLVSPKPSDMARWETDNRAPADLLWAPDNALLMAAATGGLIGLTPILHLTTTVRVAAILWWIALVGALERQSRRRRGARRLWIRILLIAAWSALTMAIINLDRAGLPRPRAVTNSAAIITMFVPLSLAAGGLLSWFLTAITSHRWRAPAVAIVTLIIAFAGLTTMTSIINPRTVLAGEADANALEWIRTHTDPRSVFAVGVQAWIGGSFIGVDGGYWIPVLADRRSLLPPGLYPWVASTADVERTDRLLRATAQAAPSSLVTLLRQIGVTHVYTGPANVQWEALRNDPRVRIAYDTGGATVYELER